MAHDGGSGNGGQSARDFLALSHGQEWTSFYDSFDKLVQDNLARSSELLRHAMSLPEVADREVADVKQEMATKIAAERQQAKEAFLLVHKDLVTCQEQGEALQRSMTSWMADLARLGDKVNDLVQRYDAVDDAPVVEAVAPEPDPVPEPEAEAVWEIEATAEVAAEPETGAEAESDAFAEAVAEVSADSSEELAWDSDISFADVVGGDAAVDGDDGSSPQKPAWLSVGRQSAAS
jgi:hypothetical protein